MKRVLKKTFRWSVAEVPRQLEHKVIERPEHPSVLRPSVREVAHRNLFSFDQRRRDTKPLQHFTDRDRKTRRQGICFFGGQYYGKETTFTDAKHELMRP